MTDRLVPSRSYGQAGWFYDEAAGRRVLRRQVVYLWRDNEGRRIGMWRWEEWA